METKVRSMMRRVMVVLLIAALCVPAVAFAKQSIDYYVTVDQTNQIVTVYRISDGMIVRQMLCSAGLNGATPNHTYSMPKGENYMDRSDWYHFTGFRCYAKYPTRVFKGVLFHSITYNKNTEDSIAKSAIREYGHAASHGCIRLLVEDAKWIQDNCPIGTKVKVYESHVKDQNLWNRLFQEHYTLESGLTYSEFLGGAISRYSSSEDIMKLQDRLRELGYYTGKVDGSWNDSTSNALVFAQLMTGSEISGNVTSEFAEVIYADDAPAIPGFDFDQYMYEPAVRLVQNNLKAIGLYSGEVDGLYDFEVSEAVAKFQSVYGYTQDGTPSVVEQEAMQYEADKVKEACGSDVTAEIVSDTIQTATVNYDKKIRLRSEPDSDSKEVDNLKSGTKLILLEKGDEWSKLQYGSKVGYMKNKYLEFGAYTVSYLKCTGSNGVYTIGCTMEELQRGKSQPASDFKDYYEDLVATRKKAVKQATASIDKDVQPYGSSYTEYATVNTGDASIELNLRALPSTDADVLLTLANGTSVVLNETRSDGWSMITVDDNTTGYVVSSYLTTADAANAALMAEGGAAATIATTEGFAYVYQYADKNSLKIGFTTTGSTVTAYGSKDGFTYVCYTNYKNETEEPNSYGFIKNEMLTSEYRDFSVEEKVNDEGIDDETLYATVIESAASAPLFSGANASATVIAGIPAGTKLVVLEAEEDSNWVKVEYQGVEGYVENSSLRFDNE